MKIIPYQENFKLSKNNCRVFGIYEDEDLCSVEKKVKIYKVSVMKNIFKYSNWKENFGKTIFLHTNFQSKYDRIILINCGIKKNFQNNLFILIIKKLFLLFKENNIQNIYMNIYDFIFNKSKIYWKIRDIINISQDLFYSFKEYQSKIQKISFLKKIFIKINNEKDFLSCKKAILHGCAISKGVKFAKDISNIPSNICTPKYLVKKSKNLFKKYTNNIQVQLFNQNDIKNLRMNAFLAVSQGSCKKAYMSRMNYCHKNAINKNPIILIGKGVTFDSGGLSIKPSYMMDEMKYDMCGAAAVIGIMKFIVQSDLPLRVIGIIGTCENMINGNSLKPGDIIQTMSKKTVEILNTDAEGRLILCDLLTYAEKFDPMIVIDIATLTGSCVATLGNAASGLFSNSKILEKEIKKASKNIHDKIWSLPNFKIYKKYLKSNFADLLNIGGKYAGASTAAYFLSYFAKKYKWVHLDIAGTAWRTGKNKSATGQPVTLLCQYFLNLLKKNKL
ncbi:leucyl aminopeptidase [Buchnera aphidicola]|uniref:leucyl aminopeptidase n=1 Tax=Buchnera aphidicola TaxID=9 RepID=UPI0034642D79